MYRKTTLPNGVRILTDQMASVKSVTFGIWAHIGSANEPDDLRGMAHYLEHMLFKGTTTRDAQRLSYEMESVGGSMNAWTDREATCYTAKVMGRHLTSAFDVISDMLLNPLLDEADHERERTVIIEELRSYSDDPERSAHELFPSSIWTGPLSASTIGTEESINRISAAHLREHLRTHYGSRALVVTAAGDVEHDAFVELVEARFGSLPDVARAATDIVAGVQPRTIVENRKCGQAHVLISASAPSLTDPDHYASTMLTGVLGAGTYSRLFQEIREKRGLAYTAAAIPANYRRSGALCLYAGTAPERVNECLTVMREEMVRIAQVPPTDEEMHVTRERIRASLEYGLESTGARNGRLGNSELMLGRHIELDEAEAKIDAVTAGDVSAIARRFFAETGLVVVGDIAEDAVAA